jgi:hypothetical protein
MLLEIHQLRLNQQSRSWHGLWPDALGEPSREGGKAHERFPRFSQEGCKCTMLQASSASAGPPILYGRIRPKFLLCNIQDYVTPNVIRASAEY